MQRQLLAAVAVTVTEEGGEILENGPCQTVDELKILDRELENKEKSAKMVILLQDTQMHLLLPVWGTWGGKTSIYP